MCQTYQRRQFSATTVERGGRTLDIRASSWSNRDFEKNSRSAEIGWHRWRQKMIHGQSVDVLSMFLMGPREVMVIVIITAVIVWLRMRRRP